MVTRSTWISLASQPGELEGVILGPRGKAAVTLEVVGTKATGVADMMTWKIWIWKARVLMTATPEEITETIMMREMRRVYLM